MQKSIYPDAANCILKDTYVDDCATSVSSVSVAESLAENIICVLNKGGFATKGFTISTKPPLASLTKEGISINVAGLRWSPEKDVIQINMKPFDFYRKHYGKKLTGNANLIVPQTTS